MRQLHKGKYELNLSICYNLGIIITALATKRFNWPFKDRSSNLRTSLCYCSLYSSNPKDTNVSICTHQSGKIILSALQQLCRLQIVAAASADRLLSVCSSPWRILFVVNLFMFLDQITLHNHWQLQKRTKIIKIIFTVFRGDGYRTHIGENTVQQSPVQGSNLCRLTSTSSTHQTHCCIQSLSSLHVSSPSSFD